MKFEIVHMEDLSGEAAKIYSVVLEGDSVSMLEHFIKDNSSHGNEIREMIAKLYLMGHKFGCKSHYFKDKEGNPGDGMVALRYGQMRLYCLRFDNTCIFVGGGGYKPPGIAAYEDDEVLNSVAGQMKRICASINKAIVAKDLIVKPGGDLEITDFIDLEI